MLIKDEWLDIEYLVFSSHKTATQTIVNSLLVSGKRCRHAHVLNNMDLEEGEFRAYLQEYGRINNGKLQIISVFRDPIERLVSSFFESLSENPDAWTNPENQTRECGDFNMPFEKLQALFSDYCRVIDGWGESITEFCRELDTDISRLHFSEGGMIGRNEFDACVLHLLRFDLLIAKSKELLSGIGGFEVRIKTENRTKTKEYADVYAFFRSLVNLPTADIKRIYEVRRELVELFYEGQFDAILAGRIQAFGRERRIPVFNEPAAARQPAFADWGRTGRATPWPRSL